MSLNLCLHCGAHEADLDAVDAVVTPEATDKWFPVPHSLLLEHVTRELEANQLRVIGSAHALSRSGNRYFGLMEVENGNANDDYNTVIGVRNSHDQSFAAGLAVGSGIFVCDNLAFSGEITLARRHTRFIERDLAGLIGRCMGAIGTMRCNQDQRIAAYKDAEMSDARFNDLLVRSVEQKVLPVTHLAKVLHEWRMPAHPEFAQGKTSWRAFNAFTEVLKAYPNVSMLADRTTKLHGLVDGASGITLGADGNVRRAPESITFEMAV